MVVLDRWRTAGRSCVNASGVWTTGARGRRSRRRWRERLARSRPRAPRTTRRPSSRRSPTRTWRARISAMIDDGLAEPGARDVTAAHRDGGRLVELGGRARTCCRPSSSASAGPPAGQPRVPFPFAAVVEVGADEMPGGPGPDPGAHGDHRGRGLRRPAARLAAAAPPEPGRACRPCAGELGPAARGQPLRAPIRPPGLPGRGGAGVRILALTAGAGGHVLRELPARQRAGGGAAWRAATT